ncbi:MULTISPECIES: rRNA maturation RNase YbeY [Mammaliicoccus]|uniref:Endoribonuclease YbeY n=1 Tax=Mammaliicoccus fleurettii TaxID=150056 RepID=A0ABS5MKP5_9STAP|nr:MULTISPECIES: rRNA maturation RNase YbeY [Mammaliicoccus]HCN61394.1 rRNA maturation RNase YbeY [Staphylococcus sp.]MBL0846239.1 rRNA maturation RNase YbeY [Mammaliicoccus fleurettii]MBO3062399.1 rRNA maturation RNase YbeY [Mammaliicoccus fleurettii]MBS3671160.1 rRNA maturation RNase YbeY [Mammaliicoccus fleurettii]MBS3696466.1 rRNA maturation RNase YbeY [Mammaliicoccus fleurettii]
MLTMDFIDEQQVIDEDTKNQIESLLTFAAKKENITQEAELSISFVDEEEIQAINRDYRDKDKVTDVISFSLEEDEPEIEGLDIPRVLGDIIICLEVAKEQADSYNHSLSRELGFLALHGFLHLLGYDHMTEVDEKEMFSRQDEILNEFGLTRD